MKKKGLRLKIITVILALCTIGLLGVIVYQGVNSRIGIECISCERYSAQDARFADQYYAVCDALANKAVPGIVYRQEEPADAKDYCFTVYTFELKNTGLAAAETLEAKISARPEDILMHQGEKETVVQPGGTAQLTVVLFSQNGSTGEREFNFTYYLWGTKQEVKYRYAR